jgi:L-fuconolactonase
MAMIDAHLHLWDLSVNAYPWLAGESALRRAFLPSDVPVAGLGVDGFIVVEAGCADGRAELDWLTQLAGRWPALLGVVTQVPLERGPSVTPLLAEAARQSLTVGVRRNVQDEPPGFLLADSMVAGVRQLAAYGLPFDACVREHQLADVRPGPSGQAGRTRGPAGAVVASPQRAGPTTQRRREGVRADH